MGNLTRNAKLSVLGVLSSWQKRATRQGEVIISAQGLGRAAALIPRRLQPRTSGTSRTFLPMARASLVAGELIHVCVPSKEARSPAMRSAERCNLPSLRISSATAGIGGEDPMIEHHQGKGRRERARPHRPETGTLNPSEMCLRSHRQIPTTGNLWSCKWHCGDFLGASHERHVTEQSSYLPPFGLE